MPSREGRLSSVPNEPRRPRILVTDAMPVNGGDHALVLGLLKSLAARWPTADFTVLCHWVDQSRPLMPAYRLEAALGRHEGINRVEHFYREADLVISTPGGFLHEHYDISAALRGFQLALDLNKPLVLFAQSIGPFANIDTRRVVADVLQRSALVALREGLSLRHVLDCGVTGDHLIRVPDAAFLWRRLTQARLVVKSGPARRAALSFRRWPLNDRYAFKETVKKARRLVEHLQTQGLEEFLFLSTCQGVPGYADDSELAVRILDGLPASLRDRCTVDRARHDPEELIRRLGECDVMFSMRLHGCLLAMLGGTPAMGLAYESKTPEIFRQLGLKAYQVPFTAFGTRWRECASDLLTNLDTVRAALPGTLDRMCRAISAGVDRVDAALERSYAIA